MMDAKGVDYVVGDGRVGERSGSGIRWSSGGFGPTVAEVRSGLSDSERIAMLEEGQDRLMSLVTTMAERMFLEMKAKGNMG